MTTWHDKKISDLGLPDWIIERIEMTGIYKMPSLVNALRNNLLINYSGNNIGPEVNGTIADAVGKLMAEFPEPPPQQLQRDHAAEKRQHERMVVNSLAEIVRWRLLSVRNFGGEDSVYLGLHQEGPFSYRVFYTKVSDPFYKNKKLRVNSLLSTFAVRTELSTSEIPSETMMDIARALSMNRVSSPSGSPHNRRATHDEAVASAKELIRSYEC